MKSLTEYLIENEKKYMFRVRVACELGKDRQDKVKSLLGKYALDDMSEPKRLPIQQKVLGFEHLKNPEIFIYDIVTDYPCTPIEIQSIFNTAGIPAGLVMVTTPNQEVIAAPVAPEAKEGESILQKDLPKSTYPQMLADLEAAVATKGNKYQIKYAANGSPKAKTTNDLPQGNTSPIGTNRNKLPNLTRN